MCENSFTKVYWIRRGLKQITEIYAINKKQKYFSLLDHQLAESLVFVFGLQKMVKRG